MSPITAGAPDLTTVLRTYAAAEPRRAAGGTLALAGFDFQLRSALADFAAMLAANGTSLAPTGGVFVEALSDYARCEADRIACVQVKRTLTRATLRHAAAEVVAIDGFLERRGIGFRDELCFEIVASSIVPTDIDWSALFDDAEHGARLRALHQARRLLPPRRVDDPWWRLVSAVFHALVDPFDFARFALDRLLARTPDPADAARARDDIVERYTRSRRPDTIAALGHVPRSEDFDPTTNPSRYLLIGRAPTLDLLRDSQYMRRESAVLRVRAELEHFINVGSQPVVPRVELFWVHGRSGAGKSVLLLQLLEDLVRSGRRVVWLGGNVEQIEPLLRACASLDDALRPEFVLVDDLYDPDARDRLNLALLGRFIEERGTTSWPTLVTCGPPEFVEAFRDASRHRGFEVHDWLLEPVGDVEAESLARWFQRRTGRHVARGTAFAQARGNNGLLLSMAFEAEHGDLHQFAARFRARVEGMDAGSSGKGLGLADQLLLPLALGRLYLGAPYGWLSRAARERLEALNRDGDFAVFDPGLGPPRRYLLLTHPHLSDAIYRALRRPATPLAYANDLGDAFARALAEGDSPLAMRLLRLFAADVREEIVRQRLGDVDEDALVETSLKAWQTHPLPVNDGELTADILVSWAIWARANQKITAALGDDLLGRAVAALDHATERWVEFWQRLWRRYPTSPALVEWAARSLSEPARMAHTQWSFVWETILAARTGGLDIEAWAALGERWLTTYEAARDWHFVWRRLIPADDRPASPHELRAVELGLLRLEAAPDRAEWAFVLQDLLALPKALPPSVSTRDLLDRAWRWLVGREGRPEWTYVWQALLNRPTLLPAGVTESAVVELGWRWLTGREDRSEWAFAWQKVLVRSTALPEGVTEAAVVERGWRWLAGREERPGWTRAWETLLARPARLPAGVTEAAVVELGWRWLAGREERSEWAFVWQAVLQRWTLLPDDVTEAAVAELGWRWLGGREERPGWTRAWETMLARPARLAAGVTEAAVVELGWRWLAGREERSGWAFVWQDVLERSALLPEGVPDAAVVELGWRWLAGRDEREDWPHLWERVLWRPALLPAGVTEAAVVELGWRWLTGREDRSEWAFVWQKVLQRSTLLPPGVTELAVVELGWRWLTGHEDRSEWAFVWQDVLERSTLLPAGLTESSVIDRGFRWLVAHRGSDEAPVLWSSLVRRSNELSSIQRDRVIAMGFGWLTDPKSESSVSSGHLIEGLLDLGLGESAVAAGTGWLDRHTAHPAWPGVAAKAIVAAPTTPAAARWGRWLIVVIETSPLQKGNDRVEAALRPVIEASVRSPIIDRLWSVLSARPRDVDEQLQRLADYVTSKEPVTARMMRRKNRPPLIVVQGVRAELNHPVDTVIHDRGKLQVIVTGVDAERRRVQVRLVDVPRQDHKPLRGRLRRDADETVRVGAIEDGRIDNIKPFGLFVEFRGFVGLVHKNRLPLMTDPERDFQRGTAIRVRVSAIDVKGIHLSPADEE